jgi:hypothetical protein
MRSLARLFSSSRRAPPKAASKPYWSSACFRPSVFHMSVCIGRAVVEGVDALATASGFGVTSSSMPVSRAMRSRSSYIARNFQVVSTCSSGNGGAPDRRPSRQVQHHGAVLADRIQHHRVSNSATTSRMMWMLSASSRCRFLHRDRHREVRDAVKEVGGAVERIDDPARLHRIALDLAAFFEQEAPVGPRRAQFVDQRRSARWSAIETKSAGPLRRDLQVLDLAEIAPQARRRLARGAFHDSERPEIPNQFSCVFLRRQEPSSMAPSEPTSGLGSCLRRSTDGSISSFHIFPLIHIDDDARAGSMCGGTITRTPLSSMAGL